MRIPTINPFLILALLPGILAAAEMIRVYSAAERGYVMTEKVSKTDAEWRAQLTPLQYHVTREASYNFV